MSSHTLTFFISSGYSFKSYRHPIFLQGDCGRKSEKYGILTVILVMFNLYSQVTALLNTKIEELQKQRHRWLSRGWGKS